nr:Fic family protein [Burkholderia cepacia]
MCPHTAGACPCANWDYKNHDGHGFASLVRSRCKTLQVALKDGKVDYRASTTETRATHKEMFAGLTPKGCGYFAGNFRGSQDCLVGYDLSSPPNTTPAVDVEKAMAAFTEQVDADWSGFETRGGEAGIVDSDDLLRWIDVALERMVTFLAIHPYANGNGHISRFLILCYLGAAGFYPESWPVDKRPPDPYINAIVLYRNGFADDLRELVLKHINGEI